MTKKHFGLTASLIAAALAGCSGGGSSGGGGSAAPPVTGVGIVSSALPAADRDATGYTFTSQSLNAITGAGRVDAVGIAPNATDTLAISSPLNEIQRIDANGRSVEDSFFAPASSLANVGTYVFAATRDRTTSSNGDVFARTQVTQGVYQWSTALNNDKSEAYVAATGGEVYALVGGMGQGGEVWTLDQVNGGFSMTAAVGSWIPTAASAVGNDVYVGATRNGQGGGEAQLIRMRSGVTEEIAIPGAGAGGNVRQEVTGMATIANVGSGAGSETLVLTVGSFDLASNSPLGGFVVATNGRDFEVMNSFSNASPTSVAYIDSTLYVGLTDGTLTYRESDGTWSDEPNLPANDGIYSLLARDSATLVIGCRGANGAQVLIRVANSKLPVNPTTADVYYDPDVAALIDANCSVCHANTAVASGALNLTAPIADMANFTEVVNFVDTGAPASSALVIKGTGGNAHQGGTAIQPGSADEQLLIDWITQGARFEAQTTPPPPPPPALSVYADVKGHFVAACQSCHAGRTGADQFTFTGNNDNADWTNVRQFTDPGTPAMSEIFNRAVRGSGHPVMPWAGNSTAEAEITTWINDGRLFQ